MPDAATNRIEQHVKARRVGIAFIVITLLIVGYLSRYSLFVVLLDGGSAAAILTPLVLGGLAILPVFGGDKLPFRWQLLLGATIGIGAGACLVLTLGLFGSLSRTIMLAVLVVGLTGGAARLWAIYQERKRGGAVAMTESGTVFWRLLWLPAMGFLVIAVLAASAAPGAYWREEGYGYDVLEYHLQVPKEYLQAGRVTYLPHNVYANFPSNVEMLYLVAMIIHDDVYNVGTIAQMIHLALGLLTVYGAWVVARDVSPRAGIVAGMSLAVTGWLTYLSALAYNDNGVLFFGVVSIGCLLRASRPSRESIADRTFDLPAGAWLILSGLAAGFACGCKYTGIVFVALPVGVMAFAAIRGGLAKRVKRLALVSCAAIVAFSPWLVKNVAFTGNPVFPLANSVFSSTPPGWGPAEAARWNAGHEPGAQEREIGSRLAAFWRRVPGDADQRFGPMLLLLGPLGLLGRRRSVIDVVLVGILAIQLLVWLFATHLYARFATPMMLPLALLAGRAIADRTNLLRAAIGLALVAAAAWNFVFTERLYSRENVGDVPASVFYEGRVPGHEYLGFVNRSLPRDAKLFLVGDARAFYIQRPANYFVVFNQQPLAEWVREGLTEAAIFRRMHNRGYTHVLVNWPEVTRLRATYGFPPELTRDLFARLEQAGLRPIRDFGGVPQSGIELYEVPR